MMRVLREEIFASPFLGIYSIATEKEFYIPAGFDKKHGGERFTDVLKVPTRQISVYTSQLLGIFAKANSFGMVVPKISQRLEGVENVTEISDKMTAIGNLILANDRGAVISPEFSKKAEEEIREGLGVPEVFRGTIGGSTLVGSKGFATNRGALLSPNASESEIAAIKSALKLKTIGIGSLNRGSGFVGACATGNSNGLLVGTLTTPIEITRLEDVFEE